MFIEITWKNSKGDTKVTLVESTKVQGFINGFIERKVIPKISLPENVVPVLNVN
jgi:hypothetical protein